MSDKVYKGDIGVEIRLDTEEDLAGATGLLIKYRKPSGRTGEWSASVFNTTVLRYITTVATDLDEEGCWKVKGYGVNVGGSFTGHTLTGEFTVSGLWD